MIRMKYKIVYLLTVSILLLSCKENKDDIIVHKLDHYLWQYSLGNNSDFQALEPAIDSIGNIYLVRVTNGKNSILKLSNDGLKLGEFYEQAIIDSRPVIFHNSLYYHTKNNKLYCRDTKENIFYYQINQVNTNLISWTGKSLYFCATKNYSGEKVTYLNSYRLNGMKKWSKKLATESDSILTPQQITAYGNKIYVGLTDKADHYHILKISQEEVSPVIEWQWDAPPAYTAGALKEFSLDADGNIYLGMETGAPGKNAVISITPEGEKRWETASGIHHPIEGVSIDEHGNLYVADSLCQKISREGEILWTSKKEPGLIYTSGLAYSPLIHSASSIAYFDDNRILTNVDGNGKQNWIQYIQAFQVSKKETFLRLTQNRNGNILVLTNKRIMAFAGGEDAFDEQLWPKLYYDFGNSGAR